MLTNHNTNIENVSTEDISKSLLCNEFYILRTYFSTKWLPPKNYKSEIQFMVGHEFMEHLFKSTFIVFFVSSLFCDVWQIALNLFQKWTWDPCNIYDWAVCDNNSGQLKTVNYCNDDLLLVCCMGS